MKIRKFLVANIMAFFLVAIVGSGFSLWFFGNNAITENKNNLNKDVTQLIAIGSFETIHDFSFNFDQSQQGRTDNAAGSTLGGTPNGIQLVFENDAHKQVKYNGPTGSGVVDSSDSLVRTFTVQVTVTKALAEYFTLNKDVSATDWILTSSSTEIATTYTFSSTTATTFDWAKVSVAYAENKEPKNVSEYNAFKNIVSNDSNTINVVYSVTITAAA